MLVYDAAYLLRYEYPRDGQAIQSFLDEARAKDPEPFLLFTPFEVLEQFRRHRDGTRGWTEEGGV